MGLHNIKIEIQIFFLFLSNKFLNHMKRIVIILAVLFIIGIAFSSCQTHKPCPAYGSVGSVDTEQEVIV